MIASVFFFDVNVRCLLLARVDVVASVNLIERSVASDDRKFALRALRRNSALRRRLTSALFARLLPHYYPESQKSLLNKLLALTGNVSSNAQTVRFVCLCVSTARQVLCIVFFNTNFRLCFAALDQASMQIDDAAAAAGAAPSVAKTIVGTRSEILPEVDAYFRVLIILFLLDNKKDADVRELRRRLFDSKLTNRYNHETNEQAYSCASDALTLVRDLALQRRRSLEPLSWRVERYARRF